MEEQELLWSSSQQELVRGIALRDGQYRCLLCGAVFPQGEVFPRGGRFYDAEAMAALHLREAHGSVLEYLLHRNPGLLGLSEVQLELLRMLAEGCTDKEIAAQKRVSPSTVRNHRFKLREKERQAILAACFDEAGALRQWPAREKRKLVVLSAIAEQFKPGRQYTEKEVNRLLGRIYEDFPYLRRLLIEYGFLERTASGSAYWRKE